MPRTQSLAGGTLCLDVVNIGIHPHGDEGQDGGQRAPAVVARIERFRTALRRLLVAEARGEGAAPDDVAALNRILSAAGARRGLVSTVRGFGWGWLDEPAEVEQFLWRVAFSAARLLEGPDLVRLKTCGGCGRLFLDASRNRSRRWCDMQSCGNRAKAARHRARKD